jgi:hypothetical protein
MSFKTNTDAIAAFFTAVTKGGTYYGNVTWLMQNVFVPDDATPPTVPRLGLAASADPAATLQFVGVDDVTAFFTALLVDSFSQSSFYPVPNTMYCYSSPDGGKTIDGNTITAQARLDTGLLQQPWYPKTFKKNFYSLPLSDIDPDKKNKAVTTVPVCAVFTFDPGSHKIKQLGAYMDRWQMAAELWTKNRAFPHP